MEFKDLELNRYYEERSYGIIKVKGLHQRMSDDPQAKPVYSIDFNHIGHASKCMCRDVNISKMLKIGKTINAKDVPNKHLYK